MATSDDPIALFKSIGLTQAKAAEAAKSPKSAAILRELIEQESLVGKLDDKKAVLVSALAGALSKAGYVDGSARSFLVDEIVSGNLKSVDQVNVAVKYVDSHPFPVDRSDFNQACGVGFSITPEALLDEVTKALDSLKLTGWTELGSSMGSAKNLPSLRWANPLEIKNAVEKLFTDRFGPKGATANTKAKAGAPTAAQKPSLAEPPRKSVFEEGFLGALHKPGGNPQINPQLTEKHLATTGGHVWTRFPPEPNGYLHIGHSKAIFVNFGYAAHHSGSCYLRYDDTNPEKEKEEYFDSILEMVRWLGFEPWKITYSSDYFDQLYELAVELIRRDKAYVCHCTQEEIRIARGEDTGRARVPCSHRSRPIAESLQEFEDMKNGKYRPKEANLRMKQDLDDPNPQMWDLTAYRVLDTPHHRTGDKWKIYPTYDFTHCLVDSIENISHSLCTVEFIASRQSYDWLCDALEVYKPRQSEYGRLSLEGTITSKRKLHALVEEGFVSGWDDPRLYTLIALRRRGVPPGAITSFVGGLGVSTANTSTEVARFEQSTRHYLENTVPRLMLVTKPLKLTIENLADDYVHFIQKPLHPKLPELGTATIPFTKTIYIEADDFRLQDSKDYFRLSPGKTVGLFQAPHPITCTSFKTNNNGDIVEVICRLENGDNPPKPKAYIQWVAEHKESGSPVVLDEIRIYHRLFETTKIPADFRSEINTDSLEVIKGALGEVVFWSLARKAVQDAKATSKEGLRVGNECVRFQGLRTAYFALDKDAKLGCLGESVDTAPGRRDGDSLILNRIVTLKEDSGKTG